MTNDRSPPVRRTPALRIGAAAVWAIATASGACSTSSTSSTASSSGPDGAQGVTAGTNGGTAAGSNGGTASGTSTGATGGSSTGPVGHLTGTARIMPLGDSITRATCWRALLWQELDKSFPSRFDFVGSAPPSDPGCGVTGYDQDNEGHSSALITEIVAGITDKRTCDPMPCPTLDDLKTSFMTNKPDAVLMHFGTNDVWNGISASSIISAYSAVIDAMRAANPKVIVLLAEIIPMNVTSQTCSGCSCASCPTAVPALNSQIATWAPTKSTADSPIVVVDQYTGFDAVQDTRDGVHPNTQGSQKMADKWNAALAPLLQ